MDEQGIIKEAAKTGFASEAAERSLMASIISRFEDCAHIVSELTEEDFTNEAYRIALKAVKRAKAEGLTVDLISLDAVVRKLCPERFEDVMQRIMGCLGDAAPWAVESHGRILKELTARRQAINLIGAIGEELKDPSNDVNGIVDELRTRSSEILVGGHTWETMGDVMMKTFEHIEKRVKGEIKSITSGISNLDTVIGGFFGGELTVIGARPAVGKSIFGMNVALAAAKQGYKVGIISREMTDIQYGQRIMAYASGVDGSKIRKAEIEYEDWGAMATALGEMAALQIEFLFTVRTVDELRAEIQRKYNRGEIDLLIVDYLQLMDAAQKFDADRLRVGYISKALKDIATDFKIPVVALAQVKRYAGGARAKMPTLEDLKDSGSIEQDADNVIFLHNPYDETDDFVDPRDREYFKGYVQQGYTYQCLGVAKQRQGVTGVCCVLFNKYKMRYFCIDRTGGAAK